jgi:hypothetical protein
MKSFDEKLDLVSRMKWRWIAESIDEIGDKVAFGQGETDSRVLIQQSSHQRGATARHPDDKHRTEKRFPLSRCVHWGALQTSRQDSLR